MQILEKAEFLDRAQRTLFNDLRKLRNQAAHIDAFKPAVSAAMDYIALTSQLVSFLKEHRSPGNLFPTGAVPEPVTHIN